MWYSKLAFWLKGYYLASARKFVIEQFTGRTFIEIRKQQWVRLTHLHQYFFDTSADYASWSNDRTQFPITDKGRLRKWLEGLKSVKGLYQGSTSGSSGEPFRFVKDKHSHAITWAVIQQYYSKLGVSIWDKQARFYAEPTTKGSWKVKLQDAIMNRKRFVVHDMSEDVMQSFVARFKRDRFQYVYGYANAIHEFSKYLSLEKQTLKEICPSLKCVIVTSERCDNSMRDFMEAAFGIPVYIEYGTSEVGIIAIENKQKELLVCEEQVMLETLDSAGVISQNGEPGLFLLSSIFNTAMPFIRYKLGDEGILGFNQEGQLIIKELHGRISETLHLKNGKKSPGLTLYYVGMDLAVDFPSIIKYQFTQKENLEVILNVVSSEIIEEKHLEHWLKNSFENYLKDVLPLRVEQVAQIPNEISGKFKNFISEVPHD